MVKLDIYAIYVKTGAHCGEIVDLYNSFEECMEHRKEFANWWSPNGDVWIKHYSGEKDLCPDKEWHINEEGNIISQ